MWSKMLLLSLNIFITLIIVATGNKTNSYVFTNNETETPNQTIIQPPKSNSTTIEKRIPGSQEVTTSQQFSNIIFSNNETETSVQTVKSKPNAASKNEKIISSSSSSNGTKTSNKTKNNTISNNATNTSNQTTKEPSKLNVNATKEPPKLYVNATKEKIIFGLYEATLNIDKSLNSLNSHSSNNDQVNIVVSPLSIIAAMTLILLGASGETKSEVGKLFGFDANIIKEIESFNTYQELGSLLKYFEDHSGETLGSHVNLAKGIFIQDGYNITTNFKDVAKNVLSTELLTVNFKTNGPQAQKTINKWVSTQTHGRINNIMPHPPLPDTKTIITSALYFTGEWEYPFFINYTRTKPFYYGSIIDDRKIFKQHNDFLYVSMMVGNSEVLYHKNDELHFKAIGLPYKGNKFVTYFVLPNTNVSLRALVNKMDKFSLRKITNNTKLTEFTYFVPKMKLASFTNLKPVLQKFGINKMFDPETANFTNMASDSNVYISDILHKVEVDINEIGTTASAATVVTITRGGQATFNVNKPFMFFIHHVESDTIIFWGTVYKPTPYQTVPPPTTTEKSNTAN